MTHPVVIQFIAEVKKRMAEHAEAAMIRPKRELFEAGEMSGIYQGMQKSLDILDEILSDQYEKELKS
jgi:hypothetical protein